MGDVAQYGIMISVNYPLRICMDALSGKMEKVSRPSLVNDLDGKVRCGQEEGE